jgi:hypothetical protein
MGRHSVKLLFILVIAGTLTTCVDPFYPRLKKFESWLVVDALLTDDNTANYVMLTRSREDVEEEPQKVTGATVVISDDLDNSTTLTERHPGEYRTDSLTFRGSAGRTYTLSISTKEGDVYISDPCTMYPVPGIDSIYFSKDQVLSEKTGETLQGVRIYIDTRDEGTSNYYRWTYDEWWKFNAPDPQTFEYLNDTTIYELSELKQTCWAHKKSDVIDIQVSRDDAEKGFIMKPVLFVDTYTSDRFLIQYCIDVCQLSMSQQEYEFWNLMVQLNESGGDIFDKQPFQPFSNIRSISNPDEQVLGYFQVSGAKHIRKYITVREIIDLDLPLYVYDCERIERGPIDYPELKITFNQIYKSFVNSGFQFIKPTFDADGRLLRFVFVRPFCANCTVNGSLTKPYFWVDME